MHLESDRNSQAKGFAGQKAQAPAYARLRWPQPWVLPCLTPDLHPILLSAYLSLPQISHDAGDGTLIVDPVHRMVAALLQKVMDALVAKAINASRELITEEQLRTVLGTSRKRGNGELLSDAVFIPRNRSLPPQSGPTCSAIRRSEWPDVGRPQQVGRRRLNAKAVTGNQIRARSSCLFGQGGV